MSGKMLVAGAVAVAVLAMALSGGTSAEEDDYVQVYISIDSNRVDIFIEGSNLEDELATIDEIGDALERLYGITNNIYYHVNELDDTRKQEMQRLRDVEAELGQRIDQNTFSIGQNTTSISLVKWEQRNHWIRLEDLGRGLNETQVIMLCLFAIGICLVTITHSLAKQSMWKLEDEQDKLKNRVAALEVELKKTRVKRSK